MTYFFAISSVEIISEIRFSIFIQYPCFKIDCHDSLMMQPPYIKTFRKCILDIYSDITVK